MELGGVVVEDYLKWTPFLAMVEASTM